MATIVLVPGAFHGAWYYSPIMPRLRAAGHEVFAISLSGLDGPASRARVAINLDTHIADVVSLIEHERLTDVVLCGHSYGGMVIAGAADALQGKIRTLLFIDALAPNDGDSVWNTWAPEIRDGFIMQSQDGLVTPPPPGVDPRARAHPLATFLQPVSLSAAAYKVPNKVYALCAADVGSPFHAIHDRVAADPTWTTHKLGTGHDFMNQAPELGLSLILKAAEL
ncbi:MAG: alpha/beta fold hydrolase [Novosphingobium sp.]|nr:alpha/beta fold hydrolase [Novosphingobium sp.]